MSYFMIRLVNFLHKSGEVRVVVVNKILSIHYVYGDKHKAQISEKHLIKLN